MIRLTLGVLALNAGFALGQEPIPPNRKDPLEVVDFRDRTLNEAMRILSLQTGLNIVPSDEAGKVKINLYMTNGKPEAIFKALEKSYGFLVEDQIDTIYIFSKEERKSDEQTREKQKRIAELNRIAEEGHKNLAAKQRLTMELEAKTKIEALRLQETKLKIEEQKRKEEAEEKERRERLTMELETKAKIQSLRFEETKLKIEERVRQEEAEEKERRDQLTMELETKTKIQSLRLQATKLKIEEQQRQEEAQEKERRDRLKMELDAKTKIESLRLQETKLRLDDEKRFFTQMQAALKKIVVKGHILNNTEPPAALLDVEGRLVRVAKGMMFTAGGLTFRVVELNATEIRLMEMQRNQVLPLN